MGRTIWNGSGQDGLGELTDVIGYHVSTDLE